MLNFWFTRIYISTVYFMEEYKMPNINYIIKSVSTVILSQVDEKIDWEVERLDSELFILTRTSIK